MTDLLGKVTDVHQTLSYSRKKAARKVLVLGLLCLALGAAIFYLVPPALASKDGMMLTFTFAVGAFCTLYGLHRTFVRGKPLLELSPAGLHLHIEWTKDVLIPWHEVRGVDTIDITGRYRGRTLVVAGVTVVLVSRTFYDRYIHVNSWFLRGPGWEFHFVPKGDMVQVALHHHQLPATAIELREAVTFRWQAFRNVKPAAARATGPRIFGGFRPKA